MCPTCLAQELDEAGIPDMEEFENPVVDASGDPGYTEVVDATRASHTVGEDTEIVDLEDGPDAHLPPSIRERFDLPRRKRKRRRKSEVQVPLEPQGAIPCEAQCQAIAKQTMPSPIGVRSSRTKRSSITNIASHGR